MENVEIGFSRKSTCNGLERKTERNGVGRSIVYREGEQTGEEVADAQAERGIPEEDVRACDSTTDFAGGFGCGRS